MEKPQVKVIEGVPEYIDFRYRFDYFSVFAVVSFVYSIPSILILVFMIQFHFRKPKRVVKSGLRREIFGSFLLMQTSNVFLVVLEMGVSRIPNTSLLTSWCASHNPERILKTLQMAFYTFFHAKILYTFLFCLLRVVILFAKPGTSNEKPVRWLFRCSPMLLLISFSLTLPYLFITSECLQLGAPYPNGAITILAFRARNTARPNYFSLEFFLIPVSLTVDIVLTALMFWKLAQKRALSSSLNQKTDSRSEKTLTATTLLIVTPELISGALMICGSSFGFYPYWLRLVRPYFVDARAHVVTVYFYLTHPMFREKTSKFKLFWRPFDSPTSSS